EDRPGRRSSSRILTGFGDPLRRPASAAIGSAPDAALMLVVFVQALPMHEPVGMGSDLGAHLRMLAQIVAQLRMVREIAGVIDQTWIVHQLLINRLVMIKEVVKVGDLRIGRRVDRMVLVFRTLELMLAPHRPVRMPLEVAVDSRMIAQEGRQLRMGRQELSVAHQARIGIELPGNFWMRVEVIVESVELRPRYLVVPLFEAFKTRLAVHEPSRILAQRRRDTAVRRQEFPQLGMAVQKRRVPDRPRIAIEVARDGGMLMEKIVETGKFAPVQVATGQMQRRLRPILDIGSDRQLGAGRRGYRARQQSARRDQRFKRAHESRRSSIVVLWFHWPLAPQKCLLTS